MPPTSASRRRPERMACTRFADTELGVEATARMRGTMPDLSRRADASSLPRRGRSDTAKNRRRSVRTVRSVRARMLGLETSVPKMKFTR
jgi:hypothetical protein